MTQIGDYTKIGDWVRDERKAQRIRQSDFETITGYSAAHISHIENGHDIPSITMATNMLNALGYRLVFGVERIS